MPHMRTIETNIMVYSSLYNAIAPYVRDKPRVTGIISDHYGFRFIKVNRMETVVLGGVISYIIDK